MGKGIVLVPSPRNLAKRTLMITVAALALIYCVDYLWFRIRMIHPRPTDPLESLKATRLLAIPEKGGKTSYEIDQQNPEQTITCVHSWFPHAGYSPCWYVKPRINQPIPVTIIRVSMDRREAIN